MTVGDSKPQGARLLDLNRRMTGHSLAGYWQPRQRKPDLVACLWPWSAVHSCLMEAGELVELGSGDDAAFRRVVQLINPALTAEKSTSRTLQVSVQLVQPGETADCHRHSAAALRFVIEGDGTAFTNVEGEPMLMAPGDLVLTPSWTWHSHENPGDKPVIWLDVLDSPLAAHLGASSRENYSEQAGGTRQQPITKPEGYCRGRVSPVRENRTSAGGRTLPYAYRWRDTSERLLESAAAGPLGQDGGALDFMDPLTGGPTLPTIGCSVEWIAPNQTTRRRRHTSCSLYHIVRGSGATTVGKVKESSESLVWSPRDSLFVPPDAWYQHRNSSRTEPAILFCVTDRPVLESLGLYREELG